MPIASISKISNESVKKGTGKDWDEWIKILNKSGGRVWNHQDIVAFLKKKYKLSLWWQQMVTTSYEIAIGRREEGKDLKGYYGTVATRSFTISKKELWKLLNSEEGVRIWLKPISEFKLKPGQTFETDDEFFGEVRTIKPGERARLRWQEADWEKHSIVELMLINRPKGCAMAISHNELTDPRLRPKFLERWKRVLDGLANLSKK